MAGLYLGTNTVANLYLGTTEVCSAYLGANQPFDNCTYTPSTLTLLYQSSYGGDRAYLITDNPSNGTVLSGQPGTTDTFVISDPSYPTGFQGYPNPGDTPDLSSTSNISATFPASGNLNVTGPTRLGGLNTIPTPNDTVLNVNVSSGSNFSVSPSSFTHSLANDGQTFSFTTAVCPNNNYQILQQPTNPSALFTFSSAADSNGCWSGTYTGNMNQFTQQQTTTQNTTINATATLQPYSFTATVTNNISTTAGTPTVTASLTNQANVSLLAPGNAGGVTNTHTYTITGAASGTSYVLGASAYVQGSNHSFSSGSPIYTPNNSITINSAGSYSITVTGQTQTTTNYYSVDVSPGAVAGGGDPCTNLNATSTYYWADPDSNAYGNTAGSSAENIAPSGTTVYATSSGPSGSTFSGGNGNHLVSQPGTGDDYYQYISSSGVVGTDYECN